MAVDSANRARTTNSAYKTQIDSERGATVGDSNVLDRFTEVSAE